MPSRSARLSLLVLVLAMSQAAAAAGKWYVDGVNGDDSNNCKTKANACGTIGHAISLAASGDSISIAAATYEENNLSIPFSLKLTGAGAATTVVDGTYSGNVFVIGAASSHVTISGLMVKRAAGPTLGGAIANAGVLTVSNVTLLQNTAGSGGAIGNTGKATVKNTLFSKNGTGGVHYASCGAIDNRGTLTITDSTLDSNSDAPTNFTFGGAICNNGTLTINGSTLSNNTSDGVNTGAGGAIYNSAKLAINNSTFAGNSASGGGYGGGAIYNEGGSVKISNSTLSGNSSATTEGGGLNNASGTVVLQNTIVANNDSGGNCSGTVSSKGYNLSSDATCNLTGSGDMNNTDPTLGPLQNNGGPTQTMSLPSGSPAIDAGNPAGCTDNKGHPLKTDQRGQPRPDKEDAGGCDIGAYESQTS